MICAKEFELSYGLQKHMKQHLTLNKLADSGLDLAETDLDNSNEQKVSNEDLIMDISVSAASKLEDEDLSSLVGSNPTSRTDPNNLFVCNECSIEVISFEKFEKHIETHFMEIQNASQATTSSTQKRTEGNIRKK